MSCTSGSAISVLLLRNAIGAGRQGGRAMPSRANAHRPARGRCDRSACAGGTARAAGAGRRCLLRCGPENSCRLRRSGTFTAMPWARAVRPDRRCRRASSSCGELMTPPHRMISRFARAVIVRAAARIYSTPVTRCPRTAASVASDSDFDGEISPPERRPQIGVARRYTGGHHAPSSARRPEPLLPGAVIVRTSADSRRRSRPPA